MNRADLLSFPRLVLHRFSLAVVLPSSLAVILALAASLPVSAHAMGISRGDYRLIGSDVEAQLIFARPEIMAAFPEVDSNRDGSISTDESRAARAAIESKIVKGLRVLSGTAPCEGTLEDILLSEQDGLTILARYRCPGSPQSVSLSALFLEDLSPGHRHIVTARTGPTMTQAVVFRGSPGFHILAPSGGGAGSASVTSAGSMFRLGVERILTGYDHLLFLVGLILVGGRPAHGSDRKGTALRSHLAAVAAFTLAHSITLVSTVLGGWAPSRRMVGPLIALTIAYVGVENWFVRDAKRRWMLAFPFGLIHGFGLAGAFAETSVPREQMLPAVASFNIGLEAGQIAFLLVALPLLLWLRTKPWFAARGAKIASACIALAGLCLFIARVRVWGG